MIVPFDRKVSATLESEIRKERDYVDPKLAEIRHAKLTDGYFVTDASDDGFLLCMSGGSRHFGAFEVPSTDGNTKRVCSNSTVGGFRKARELYEEALRRPELVDPVFA